MLLAGLSSNGSETTCGCCLWILQRPRLYSRKYELLEIAWPTLTTFLFLAARANAISLSRGTLYLRPWSTLISRRSSRLKNWSHISGPHSARLLRHRNIHRLPQHPRQRELTA